MTDNECLTMTAYRPQMTDATLCPSQEITVLNEYGKSVQVSVPQEVPLTVQLEDQEIVTLMTLGTEPEALALGYIFNQRLVTDINAIKSVHVDWAKGVVDVQTQTDGNLSQWREKLFKRIVTSGCGQGTIFASTLEELDHTELTPLSLAQSQVYALIERVSAQNTIYKTAGAVHGCALCSAHDMLIHVEDVGRHNAADAIAGHMWLEGIDGRDKIFYTTGRLTSEMVMKAAFMGISTILSRSGVTKMGLAMAEKLDMTLIARARAKHFNLYCGFDHLTFDAIPAKPMSPPLTKGRRQQ